MNRPVATLPPGALERAASMDGMDFEAFRARLASLFARMDKTYDAVARQYGFHCEGCQESCCRTTFYHHTLVEYLYLRKGLQTLGAAEAGRVLTEAHRVAGAPDTGLFCPLNESGRCLIYSCRPMICRLHGIAHELRRPDGSVHYGPGCAEFDRAVGKKAYIPFNRSGFYWELSTLERDARDALDVSGRINMTVSQMVIEHIGNAPSRGGNP
jgi:Fe-S-cluster containining protein